MNYGKIVRICILVAVALSLIVLGILYKEFKDVAYLQAAYLGSLFAAIVYATLSYMQLNKISDMLEEIIKIKEEKMTLQNELQARPRMSMSGRGAHES